MLRGAAPRRTVHVIDAFSVAHDGRRPPEAAHGRLREAVFQWARSAARYDAVSRGKYQALRARGHGHARALRSVADRLLNVACAMLRDGACFDPQRVRVAAT